MSRFLVLLVTVSLGFSAAVKSGEVTVKWQNPEKFSDIRAANENQKRFRKEVINRLTKHWVKQAERLPEGVKLEVTMTNLNLAGEVHYSFAMNREIRVIKNLYWPRMNFEYKLTEGGKVIEQGEKQLSDMMFMDRSQLRADRDVNFYEKRIISDWFVDDVPLMLANWQREQNAVMSE
jgi:hypothetical protein